MRSEFVRTSCTWQRLVLPAITTEGLPKRVDDHAFEECVAVSVTNTPRELVYLARLSASERAPAMKFVLKSYEMSFCPPKFSASGGASGGACGGLKSHIT